MTTFPAIPTTLAPGDLAELMGAFSEVTAKLQAAHEQLHSEVARLTRELGEANSQLERSRRLAALGEMAAGIAHEVRNPLGSIRLYARMLEQDLHDRPSERGVASKIAGAARVMDGVVGDVLTFAREFRLRPADVDVVELFDRVLESCCHDGVVGWRGVEIIRLDRETSVPVVLADPSLLQQALVNVVRNAFEAMAEAPGRDHTLTLSFGPSELEGIRWASLCIRDTGPGVSPEVVARMFNPFFTTRGTGTGLGLAIVHRIIDAHAGRVRVRNNEDGRGASVEFLLPADTEAIAECGVRIADSKSREASSKPQSPVRIPQSNSTLSIAGPCSGAEDTR
jgi:signal transduction histidine kinase